MNSLGRVIVLALALMLVALPLVAVLNGWFASERWPLRQLRLTADYLRFLRAQMGAAVEELSSFDEAYAAVDWSAYAELPTFEAANRRNAYSVYLEMQVEMLGAAAEGAR